MSVAITINSVTATTVVLGVTGASGGAAQIQVQYCPRDDWNWLLAPMPRFAVAASITLAGLNQISRYFFRARELSGAGVPGPWSATRAAFTTLAASPDTTPTLSISPALLVVPEPVQSWYCATEEAGYPARAMGRDDPGCALWCRPATGVYAFEATIAGGPVDTIAVLETNVGENATITVKADTTTAGVRGGAPAFATDPAPFRASANVPQRPAYHALVRLPAAHSYPIWRVEIAGEVPGNMLAATYAVLGLSRQSKNISAGKTETMTDDGTLGRNRTGTPARSAGRRGRGVEIDLSLMSVVEYETKYADLRWRIGSTDSVLLVPNSVAGPHLHDRILYGALTANHNTQPYSAKFSQSFSIDSLI